MLPLIFGYLTTGLFWLPKSGALHYPSNSGNGYGNSYGSSYNNNKSVPSDLEVMLKDFISTQTAFNKSVEEKFGKIDVLASKVDSLAHDVDLLKLKTMPNDIKESKTLNAIQV